MVVGGSGLGFRVQGLGFFGFKGRSAVSGLRGFDKACH